MCWESSLSACWMPIFTDWLSRTKRADPSGSYPQWISLPPWLVFIGRRRRNNLPATRGGSNEMQSCEQCGSIPQHCSPTDSLHLNPANIILRAALFQYGCSRNQAVDNRSSGTFQSLAHLAESFA